jgi:hypothetical protein
MSGRGGAGLFSSAISTSAALSSMIIRLSNVDVAIVLASFRGHIICHFGREINLWSTHGNFITCRGRLQAIFTGGEIF